MTTILLNSLSFLITILAAFFLKKVGVLRQEDGQRVSKIIVFITLPATIIVGVNGFHVTLLTWLLLGMGIFCNVLLILAGFVVGRRKSVVERGFYMFNLGGYNLGNFTIPFVTSFFPAAIPVIAMFDMGNSFMVAGTTQAIVETTNRKQKHGFDLRDPLRILLKSPPFIVYIVMIVLAVFHLKLPAGALVPVHFLASGNSFLSLFMIGLFMQISLKKENLAVIGRVLLSRYLLAGILAVFVYFLLPFPHFVKLVLLLIFFCPISFLTTIQATQFGVDEGAAGFASSLSMFISLIVMSSIVIFL
ncbi:AEC family transporter [Lactococcus nasutitermitis]|uniref:AEC family transporter n=1 Tax=Lactococcus nasutitermitis TaxID=1652957 RepID=A0ABV9JC89_9LACT|nr:AEC family transporter [Lactococcus nasutitermitis]